MTEIAPTECHMNPIKERMMEEIIAMIKYLTSEGLPVPKLAEKIIACTDQDKSFHLSSHETRILHKELSISIQPAKPKTILLLYQESNKNKWYNFLGPVRLVRVFMITTLISLAIFITFSLSEQVNEESLDNGILNNNGIGLLIGLIFILSAAALGGCFSGLFQINKYINNGTFDPKYESSYWIRLLLGMISGLMLAILIPESANLQNTETNLHLTIPILAMLGGFSATLTYRILTRLVGAVESIFIGKQEDITEQKLLHQKTLSTQEKLALKQKFNQQLTTIKSDLGSQKNVKEIESSIQEMINEMSMQN